MLNTSFDKPLAIHLTKHAYEKTRAYLFRDEKESVCFLFAHVVENRTILVFNVDHVVLLQEDCYKRRTRTSAVVHHRAKNYVYQRFVQTTYTGLINCHSHPFSSSRVAFSLIDDEDDLREMAYQYDQLPLGKRSFHNPTKIHCLSMVFGHESLDARGFKPGSSPILTPVRDVLVLGEKLQFITPTGAGKSPALSSFDRSTYDRQILAFGEEGQKVLSQIRVALIGCGGIGSIVSEGVLRLGIKSLTLVDHDLVSPHSLNRWQGGRPADIGKPKAHVLARHLRSMFPGIKVNSIAKPLNHPKALRAVKDVDVLLGGLDNHLTRYLLNRISIQYLIPYLDAGTAITKANQQGSIKLLSRLAVVIPGVTACMECSQIQYFDQKQLALELYDPITRAQLIQAGYIQDHPELEAPSVMPLNMLAASLLLTELLNLVTGFAPLARNFVIDLTHPNDTQLRSDSENFPEGPAKDCLNCAALLGVGDSEPLPIIHTPRESQIPSTNLPLAVNE